ncbi:hypothetical protein K439DRAFT_872317 [Ramaria rubella]|nr:hypothetical protein K439DRAFT_872317 [Ramaria rubella]
MAPHLALTTQQQQQQQQVGLDGALALTARQRPHPHLLLMLPSLNYTLSVLALLSTSLFYYEILNSADRACHIAKQAVDNAIAKLGSLLLAPLQVLHLPPHLCRPRHLPHRARLHRALCRHRLMTLTTTVSTVCCSPCHCPVPASLLQTCHVLHPSCHLPPMTAPCRSSRPASWPPSTVIPCALCLALTGTPTAT